MITITARQLEALGLSSTSYLAAVQAVRERVTGAGAGLHLINSLLGTEVSTVGPSPTRDPLEWEVMITQGVVDTLVRSVGAPVDPDTVFNDAVARSTRLTSSPQHAWMYPKANDAHATAEQKPTGSRQERAAALYKKHVIDAEVKPTNMWFKELLVKELGMTASGASTYAFDCDKDHRLLVKRQR